MLNNHPVGTYPQTSFIIPFFQRCSKQVSRSRALEIIPFRVRTLTYSPAQTSALNWATNYSPYIVYTPKSAIGRTINPDRLIQEIQGKPNLIKYVCHIDRPTLTDIVIRSSIPATN